MVDLCIFQVGVGPSPCVVCHLVVVCGWGWAPHHRGRFAPFYYCTFAPIGATWRALMIFAVDGP